MCCYPEQCWVTTQTPCFLQLSIQRRGDLAGRAVITGKAAPDLSWGRWVEEHVEEHHTVHVHLCSVWFEELRWRRAQLQTNTQAA